MCLEVMGREPKTQIAGMVAIVDMAGFGWYHVMQMTVDYVKDMVAMVQNSFPIRFREIHIVNESYLFDVVFALVKPFLTDKIRNRIRFHGGDLESLYRYVPRSILPAEYGGEQPAFNNSSLQLALAKMEDYFVALQGYGYRDNQLPQQVYERDSHPYPSFCLSGTLPDE
ncbi:alpha-tocopherol transfer protein-like [Eurytemora carolleeae]|uniref:alpha-tocopherol transfer protein-like n=1 Tax=Eurytemora carolleeae TaxID=1294199 RepID=UPI000C76C469|nr:alpha-tocopherol transfer protein-like [Eurytemora carolleeae]|eukprot:XP_023349006.1 alpha-tocopherol transfer protein-like [Eurytemora affinis]